MPYAAAARESAAVAVCARRWRFMFTPFVGDPADGAGRDSSQRARAGRSRSAGCDHRGPSEAGGDARGAGLLLEARDVAGRAADEAVGAVGHRAVPDGGEAAERAGVGAAGGERGQGERRCGREAEGVETDAQLSESFHGVLTWVEARALNIARRVIPLRWCAGPMMRNVPRYRFAPSPRDCLPCYARRPNSPQNNVAFICRRG